MIIKIIFVTRSDPILIKHPTRTNLQELLLTDAQDSALESARSSESGEESRDISRSRRARVEQQAKSKVKHHQADESLLFDAAVKFCECRDVPINSIEGRCTDLTRRSAQSTLANDRTD